MSYIIDMTTENNILERMITDQVAYALTDGIKKTYNTTLDKINAMVAEAPGNVLIKDEFKIAARNSKGIDMMLCSIDEGYVEEYIDMALRGFKMDLARAAKAPGTDIVFQYSLRIVENAEGKLVVALLYSYYYMPDKIGCGNCGEPFEKTREWAKFCSDKCRVANHRFEIKQIEALDRFFMHIGTSKPTFTKEDLKEYIATLVSPHEKELLTEFLNNDDKLDSKVWLGKK